MAMITSAILFLKMLETIVNKFPLSIEVFILINLKEVVGRRTKVFFKERISNSGLLGTKSGDQRMMGRVKYTHRISVLKVNVKLFPKIRNQAIIPNWE
jgi:hypothetical protein